MLALCKLLLGEYKAKSDYILKTCQLYYMQDFYDNNMF